MSIERGGPSPEEMGESPDGKLSFAEQLHAEGAIDEQDLIPQEQFLAEFEQQVADAPDHLEQEAQRLETLKQLQAARDKEDEITISNFRAHGATDQDIDNFRASITRMKVAELERGRLFKNQHTFLVFESLSQGFGKLDMGEGTGFEQGQDVKIRRTSGAIETWYFVGVDTKTGLAKVATIDDKTGNRLSKDYPIDQLREENQRS